MKNKSKPDIILPQNVKKIFLIMNMSLLLTMISVVCLQASSVVSENKLMTANIQNVTVREVVGEIEKLGGINFLFNDNLPRLTKHIGESYIDQTKKDFLENAISHAGITYEEIKDDFVLISKANYINQQQITIIGNVIDAQTGEGLPGVTIIIEGTSIGVITDGEGNYKIEVPDKEVVLILSFIGYQSQRISVGEQTVINVSLGIDFLGIEEVVSVGYGFVRRSDLTGSVGHVDASQLAERPAINLEQSLAGKIAGVNVLTSSGMPGGRTTISVRGFSSFNATNDPLYVVDGIIWPQGIQNLNPNDVESIDVLKDASSTAIYGTRGSNGVIMITTKRGKPGEGQVQFSSYSSVNWLPEDRKLIPLNSQEWMLIEELQYQNAPKFDPSGFTAGRYRDPIQKRMEYIEGNTFGNRELFYLDANGIPQPIYDVDWQDMSTRVAISQNHNLSYTGGDEITNFGLFFGYHKENGIIKRSFADRLSMRGVIDHQMKDWLKVGGTFSYARRNSGGLNDGMSWGITREMVEMVTFIPYQYKDGAFGTQGDYQGLERVDSPLTMINENDWANMSNDFNGNTYAAISILPGLEFTSTLGLNIRNSNSPYFRSSSTHHQRNQASYSSGESKSWQWSNRVNYVKQIEDIHSLSAVLGIEAQGFDHLSWGTGTTQDILDDYFKWNNLSAGATHGAPNSNFVNYQMQSYFGRFNYSFMNKYLLTATSRYDGSSRFGADNKFAFFPSVALGWRLSEEDFIRNINSFSNLILRASYGLTGNSEIGSYRSLANLSSNSYIIGGQRITGTAIGRLANPELQWEKTGEFNVGLNLGLFNNRISLDGDYYIKRTHDLLFAAPVPSSSGYTSVIRNIGSIENKGLEFSLNTINVQNSNFLWTTNFNISTLKNTVLALGEQDEDILYGFKNALILRVGEPMGSIYGLVRDGIWGTAEAEEAAQYGKLPGDVRIVDQNNDGVINIDDRVIIGNGLPDFFGTMVNTVVYKNFDLLIELQFSKGNDIFNNSRNSGEARQGIANSFATVLDAWTPDNQDAVLEQVRPTGAYYSYEMDTRKLEDGSFLRGRNLTFGYTIPNMRWGINRTRMYMSLQNFFLVTEYFGYDPEVSNRYDNAPASQGMAYGGYPKPRTFMFGVEVNF